MVAKVSAKIGPVKTQRFARKNWLWIVISTSMLILLTVITIWVYKHQSRVIIDKIIVQDIARLESIFKQISDECGIIGFEHERNYVDFLTVEKFAGSEVGAMNIKNLDKWHGPYVKDNPTVQEKLYEIIRTNKGYFLVPGTGVVLSNGQVIGKDIIFDEERDIYALVKDGVLVHDGQPMAVLIHLV